MLWYACYSSLTASLAQHRADANNTTSLERPLEKRGLRAGGQLPGGGRRLTSKEVRSSGGALATTTCVGRCATAHASCPCAPRLRGRPRPRRSHPGVRPPRVGFPEVPHPGTLFPTVPQSIRRDSNLTRVATASGHAPDSHDPARSSLPLRSLALGPPLRLPDPASGCSIG